MVTAATPRRVHEALWRFLVVGSAGVLVNQSLLYLLHVRGGISLVLASIAATQAAIVSNYVGHERWTFRARRLRLGRLLRFNATALGGLVITVGTLWTLHHLSPLHIMVANLVAIAAGTSWNFSISFLWTWRPEG
jgi:putative flippase GtrA